MTKPSPSIPLSSQDGGRPFIAALAAVFLGAVDLTVIATTLPRIVFDLQINTADVDRYVWVVNAYLLAYIVSIPVMGRVSDILGRTLAFQIALAIFLAGSLWSAMAGDLHQLIAARALQGAGGGALLPVTMALVGDLMPAGQRFTALGIVGAVDTLGWVLGPVWGAVLVAIAPGGEPWRWVFWINLPLGAAVAVAVGLSGRRLARRQIQRGRVVSRLDLPGTALLGGGLLLINLGLSAGGEVGLSRGSAMRALGGTRNPLSAHLGALLVVGLASLGLFLLWEHRARHPLVPRQLSASRSFLLAVLANFLIGAALIVAVVDVPVVVALLVDQDRVSSISAELLAPFTFSMALLSFAGGAIASRRRERGTALIGIAMVVAGYAALWSGLHGDRYQGMIPGLFIAGAGFGLVVAPLGARAIDAAPSSERGVAAGFVILSRLLGMTIGISTLTAVGVRRLQTLTDRVEPVVQRAGESTAEFLVRQSDYINTYAVPLSIKVVRETFLLAGGLALLAMIPVLLLHPRSAVTAARNGDVRPRPLPSDPD